MKSEDKLRDFYIPNYMLVSGSDMPKVKIVPSCPVMVFVNAKSGGQIGGELLLTYRSLLNENQVTYRLCSYLYFRFVSSHFF